LVAVNVGDQIVGLLDFDERVEMMNQIAIADLMTQEVLCMTPETSLEVVIQQMSNLGRSCVVIVDEKKPVGIITERDLVKILAQSLSIYPTRSFVAADFMTASPICIQHSAGLFEALVITRSCRIRHLPVIDDKDELVGILSQGDIAGAHFQAIEQQRQIIEEQREIIERQIQSRTSELTKANQELKALSLQDALMGIGNRRAMEVDVQYTHSNALRKKRPYCLVLLDVDYFKKYNDHYGHQAGDEALKHLARSTQESIRSTDRLYRYGGEELLLLLPETEIDAGKEVVERVLNALERAAIEHVESPFGYLTISAGISAITNFDGNDDGWQQYLQHADEKLYEAKSEGRNRICW
tara:strand:- start:874 stop:1935 length:1062 start_codon:yes stop_codon:yes gene_type:complete